MPKVSVGLTPVELYQSVHGGFGHPTTVTYRIDPDAASDTIVYVLQNDPEVDAGVTDEHAGFPLLAGEAREYPPLYTGMELWAVASATTDVYYEVSGYN